MMNRNEKGNLAVLNLYKVKGLQVYSREMANSAIESTSARNLFNKILNIIES
jgi:hypothetical protein